MTKRHPSIRPTHPGEIIREDVLPALGISKAKFAEALGISRQSLHSFLSEKSPVTAELALRLERVVGSSAETWLAMQSELDLHYARKKVDPRRLTRLHARED
ncbi:HigA family addiction module antitoxin [Hyphomicrobium sp. CS1GBMeth3]|uniref:HigA family addiction module antitoxin n=1 Tax=Hyphomicrobium sp. CS1GBMeth3 TaxID=1892845 RepID=UPI0009313D1A|nr:HigA family addiction module antitoxin [Hyphomicrobium sp. CS1GBMeth3]